MILILSSHVAASPVGGGAQAAVLIRMGFVTALAPTVLFGRHPGLGPPGGGQVTPEMFAGVLGGIAASGVLPDVQAVIAGYFAEPDQVNAAAGMIDAVRAANPLAWIIVDPIMGDAETGLYVGDLEAETLTLELVARADLITPNAWELARLAGRNVGDVASALTAARSLGRPVLASSIPAGEDIGVLYASADKAWLAAHRRQPAAPKGTGDILTALFVGHTLAGAAPADALRASVTEIAASVAGTPTPVRVSQI